MAFGTLAIDYITYTSNNAEVTATVSSYFNGQFPSLSTTGTLSGNYIVGASGVFSNTLSGSHLIASSGTISNFIVASGLTVTGSGIPTNGFYLPATNSVGISTNGTGRLFINSSGSVGIGTSSASTNVEINAALDTGASLGLNEGQLSIGREANSGGAIRIGYDTTNNFGFISPGRVGVSWDNLVLNAGGGRVGIGTTSPGRTLEVGGSAPAIKFNNGTNAWTIGTGAFVDGSDSFILFEEGTGERLRVDSSGRLLVGTSSARGIGKAWIYDGDPAQFEIESTSTSDISLITNRNDFIAGHLRFGKSRGGIGSNTIVANNDSLGNIQFCGADGTDIYSIAAEISAQVDGTPGNNDMPGRLVFSVTSDGSASPFERARVTSSGFFKASNTGSYQGATGTYHEFRTDLDDQCLYLQGTNASWNNHLILGRATQAANSSYKFALFQSGNGGDTEFNLRGDGNAYADGSWNGGGADYAEYFEWSDNNPEAQDRRGISVVLDGDKIREAVAGEDPIGVISGNPSMVGDSAWNKWSGKYLRDEFGTYIQEDYEVTDDNGNTVIQQRRKLNPAYNPDVEYISREQRPEWDCVGLMGKLRIRKGQVTGSRWIKMRDISDSVEEWLVR